MIIETERLILRHWQESDAEDLFKYASDPDVGPIAGWNPHKSVEESREIISTVFSAPETYAVVLKSTGKPVGCCGIMTVESLHSNEMQQAEAEIGYWIGKPYWGLGLIPEAVKVLLNQCFNELDIKTVWCGHYDGNSKSKRVIEKSGFQFDHIKENIQSPLGDIRTEHIYKLTSDQFKHRI